MNVGRGVIASGLLAWLGAVAAACPASAPDGLEALRLSPADFGDDVDRFELVAPVAPPHGKRGRTRVILALPNDAAIDLSVNAAGAPSLRLPAGSMIARVEDVAVADGRKGQANFTVGDVRGALVDEDDERFFVARPARAGADAPLEGFAWAREDRQAEATAHALLSSRMQGEAFGFAVAPRDRERAAAHFVNLGRCAACHERDKPRFSALSDQGSRVGFFPRRATDQNGFYALPSVFRDAEPRESYRSVDDNRGSFVTVRCAQAAPLLPGEDSCPDGAAPTVVFDTARAFAAGDAHALRVCASRRALFAHMTDAARAAFRRPLADCDIVDAEAVPEGGAAQGDAPASRAPSSGGHPN